MLNFLRSQKLHFQIQRFHELGIFLKNSPFPFTLGQKEVADLVELRVNSELPLESIEDLTAEKRKLDVNLSGKLSADAANTLGRGTLTHNTSFQEEDVLHTLFDQIVGDAGANNATADNDYVGSVR